MQVIKLEAFLPYRLNRIAAAVSQELRGVYSRRYKLTVPEWRTLATLAQFGEMTAGAIGVHAALHKTKVSRAVSALEARRWLTRTENDRDRREEFLALTNHGRKAYQELAPEMLAFEKALLNKLDCSPDALAEVLDALEKALDLK